MKLNEVKKGLIVSLRGTKRTARIESDDVNWSTPDVQYDQSRGVLVRFVGPDGNPISQGQEGLSVVPCYFLKLIPEDSK